MIDLEMLKICADCASREGNSSSHIKMFWRSLRDQVMQEREFRNPVCVTSNYLSRVDRKCIEILSQIGVTAELVENSHYPMVRIFGREIAY